MLLKPELWEYYGDRTRLEMAEYLKALMGVKEFFVK
jgi:hypothetical protein